MAENKEPQQWEPGIAKLPPAKCLECNQPLNAAGSFEHPGELPKPGDLYVCGKCGAVMLYADDLTPRGMTEPEMQELIEDTETMNELARSVARVHLFRAKPETERVQ
jgi:hypothetical protein